MLGITSTSSLAKATSIILILGGAVLVKLVLGQLIGTFRHRLKKSSTESPSARNFRLQTLSTLLDNATSIFVGLITLFLILEKIGVNMAPFLTGAGILGVAIGLGMKDLAADMVSGFFILLDNQINVGDEVEIGSVKGRVKRINLRTIEIRDEKGNTCFIPNSTVKVIVRKKRKTGKE